MASATLTSFAGHRPRLANKNRHAPIVRQRGAAALVVTMLLVFAMLLVVAFANRNVVVEARASANQYRSTQAFEAAEAGLEWALAKLNDGTPVGDDCLPSADPGALSFRDRQLRYDGSGFVPMTWDDAGTPTPLQAACVRGDAGWACSCPASGAPTSVAATGTATAPAFAVEFAAGARPGLIRAVAIGCTRSDTLCTAIADAAHEAAARVEVGFGLVPGLRAAPVAALTVRGNVDAGTSALGVHKLDPGSGATAVHAGGNVNGDALRLTAPAGSALDASIVSGDAALAGLAGDRFFARWFGMDKTAWMAQPAATRIACLGSCAGAIAHALATGSQLLAVDGDLTLDGPISLGTSERPIALVATGALRLRGAVAVHGVIVAAAIDWRDGAAGALIRGAAIAEGDYSGDAAADIVHDAPVLARLRGGSGSFARVNGSWKDF